MDFSKLSADDVANIAIQRTKHLLRLPIVGSPSYRLWLRGLKWPVLLEAKLRRKSILKGVAIEIENEYRGLNDYLGSRTIERMVDIGCGNALIDVFFWRDYQPRAIHLVDIEETQVTHHGYQSTGAGYANLRAAKALLVANGTPAELVKLTNPQKSKLHESDVDLIISIISAGFHYPIEEYAKFALKALKPGGVFIFDARNDTKQEKYLEGFTKIEVIGVLQKHRRLAVTR